jgi:hypothetical protein
MRVVVDLSATAALVATINRRFAFAHRFLAIHRFGEGFGQGFQWLQTVAGKQISMGHPPALQGTLK